MAAVLNDNDLHIDPISFDPTQIDDDESLDLEDAKDLLRQIRAEETSESEAV
jgi:hypothetical protein